MTYRHQAALGVLVVLLASSCEDVTIGGKAGKKSKQNAPGNAKEQGAVPVKAVQAKRVPDSRVLKLPGVLWTDSQSELAFRVSGLITTLPVKVGQSVKKGDALAKLETISLEDQVEEAKTSLDRAKARHEDAQAEFKRDSTLLEKHAVSEKAFQAVRERADAAADALKIARNRLAQAKRELSYATLEAPYDGVVAEKRVHAFQTVKAGDPILLLVDPTEMLFRVQLPTSMLNEKDDFSDYECVFPSAGGLKVKATFHGIGPSALAPHRTFPLNVKLSAAEDHPIRPGTEGVLRVKVTQSSKDHLVLVPAIAIVADHAGNPHAWTVDQKTGEVKRRSVEVAGLRHGKMALKSGLEPGQWVVVAGQARLTPGRKVRIVKPPDAKN